ncbi:hypothetical protein [Microvirga calopogonii]|uniref:hypothetical protein n=1 Tax=Microvirga calopogonii TaxID=2078013 RepID=UPI00197B07B7|nr:hypothetical protein [Microvirga calopogonii]
MAHWQFADGTSARADYNRDGRTLQYFDQNGSPAGHFVTSIQTLPTGFLSKTEAMEDGGREHIIIGPKTLQPGSYTIIGPALVSKGYGQQTNDPGPDVYVTGRIDIDGSSAFSYVRPLNPSTTSTGYVNIGSDGSVYGHYSIITQGSDGQTKITTDNVWKDSGGGVTNESHGEAGTNPEGGFYSMTSSYDRTTGESQRSSWGADGQGNESETTITYHADGSFTIRTVSKDADGNTSGGEQSYDKDGNPIDGGGNEGGGGQDTGSGSGTNGGNDGNEGQGGGTEGGGGGGGDTDGGGGDGTEGGGGGGTEGGGGPDDTSRPSDDGPDESPPTWQTKTLDRAFTTWIGDQLGPLGGSYKIPPPPGDLGDPVPMLRILCEDDIQGRTTTQTSAQPDDTFDLRPFLIHERDIEDDPRALVAAFAKIATTMQTAKLQQLAEILA